MKKNIVFVLALIFSYSVYGQIHFSAGASLGSIPEVEKKSNKGAINFEYFYDKYDSLKFTTKVIRDIDFKTIYSKSESYRFFGNVYFPLSENINLISGLGFDFHQFYVNTIYTHIDKIEEELPTVKVDSIVPSIYWGIDRGDYSLNDEYRLANKLRIMNVYIPIEVDYEVFNNFRINMGGNFNVALLKKYDSFQKTITFFESGYQSETATIKEKHGEAIRTITMEGFVGMKYKFFDKYEVFLSVGQYFSNIVKQPENNKANNIFQKVDFLPYSPRTYSLGINYHF